jgi:uncharacterized phage protein (TIGR02220 family)
MKSIIIPLEFFRAIGEKPHPIRIYWIKWLGEYTEHLFRPDFVDFFYSDMKGKSLNLETIKEAYDFGIKFFDDGFNFVEGQKIKKEYATEIKGICNSVILYLNEKSNSTYTLSKPNMECISARIKEGFTISDFKVVIDNKVSQWLGTEQEKYLRPITLFQAKKFENYLNEPKTTINAKPKHASNIDKLSNASNKAKQFFN